MELNEFEKEKYEQMKNKSISGKSSLRNKEKKTTFSLKEYLDRNKVLVGTCILVTSIVLTAGSAKILKLGKEKIQKNAIITELSREFYENVLKGESHRTTADRSKYYIDYNDIALKLETYGDIDEAVFFLELHYNDKELNDILKCTKYESFEGFMNARGYNNAKDFREELEKRILLSNEIKEKEQELKLMQEDHEEINENKSLGGK